jgi:hypothetical protein
VLHRQGDSSPHVELVVSGLVRVYVTAPDGRTMTVRYCRAGALIGVVSLFASPFALPATIQAVTARRDRHPPAADGRGGARMRGQRTRLAAAAPGEPALARRGDRHRRVDGRAAPRRARGADLDPDAVELVFRGADAGIQGDEEQSYARSLPVTEALRPEVLLAYEMNGRPLEPQHGFPLRLVVPDWYGMASVKWLTSVDAVAEPFQAFQQSSLTAISGTPTTRASPCSGCAFGR